MQYANNDIIFMELREDGSQCKDLFLEIAKKLPLEPTQSEKEAFPIVQSNKPSKKQGCC